MPVCVRKGGKSFHSSTAALLRSRCFRARLAGIRDAVMLRGPGGNSHNMTDR